MKNFILIVLTMFMLSSCNLGAIEQSELSKSFQLIESIDRLMKKKDLNNLLKLFDNQFIEKQHKPKEELLNSWKNQKSSFFLYEVKMINFKKNIIEIDLIVHSTDKSLSFPRLIIDRKKFVIIDVKDWLSAYKGDVNPGKIILNKN